MQNQDILMKAAANAVLMARSLPTIEDVPSVDPNEPIASDLAGLPRDGSELTRQQDSLSEYTMNAIYARKQRQKAYAAALRSVAEAADALLALADSYEALARRCDSTIAAINAIRAKGAAARAERLAAEEAARPENVLKRLEALEEQAQKND